MLAWSRPFRQLRVPFAFAPSVAYRYRNLTTLAQNVNTSSAKHETTVLRPEDVGPSKPETPSRFVAASARSASEDDLVSFLEQEGRTFREKYGLKGGKNGFLLSKRARRPTVPDAFLELCRRRSDRLEALSPHVIVALAAHTDRFHISKVVSKLTVIYHHMFSSDALNEDTAKDHFLALQCALQYLTVEYTASLISSSNHITELFDVLMTFHKKYNFLPQFTPTCFATLTKIMYTRPLHWYENNIDVVDSFVHCVRILRLEPVTSPHREISLKPSKHVWWNTFVLVKVLVQNGDRKHALSLIHALLEIDVIPAHAIDGSIAASHLSEFCNAALVRTCIHYQWIDGAARLLDSETYSDPNLLSHYNSLIHETLSGCVMDKPKVLERCSHIINVAWMRNPRIAIKASLVHTILVNCQRAEAPAAAKLLVRTLYDPKIRQIQQMIKPVGPSYVVWLLKHLINSRKNKAIGRLLAQDLVNSRKPLDARIRGTVIAMCAKGGYDAEVRKLWKRYSDGPEANAVTGHARCMLSVVKLFGKVDDGVRDLADQNDSPSAEQISNTHPTANVHVSASLKDDVRRHLAEDTVSEDAEERQPPSDALPVPDSTRVKSGDSFAAVGGVVDQCHGQSNSQSNYDFAMHVLAAFREAKEPLKKASHYDLNAYARGSSVVGHFRQSMRTLQILLQRKEVPDQHDLHIPMMIMADDDPKMASSFLVELLEQGARADSAVLSAVTLGAVKHNKKRLAVATYERLLRLGKTQSDMSLEAARSLLRIYLELSAEPSSADDGSLRKWALQRAYELVSDSRLAGTPFASGLNNRFIELALGAGEFEKVFRFWKQVVRHTVRKTTEDYKRMRHAISEGVLKAISEGRLEEEIGRRMVIELGHDA